MSHNYFTPHISETSKIFLHGMFDSSYGLPEEKPEENKTAYLNQVSYELSPTV
jgi:hypothetical protein